MNIEEFKFKSMGFVPFRGAERGRCCRSRDQFPEPCTNNLSATKAQTVPWADVRTHICFKVGHLRRSRAKRFWDPDSDSDLVGTEI